MQKCFTSVEWNLVDLVTFSFTSNRPRSSIESCKQQINSTSIRNITRPFYFKASNHFCDKASTQTSQCIRHLKTLRKRRERGVGAIIGDAVWHTPRLGKKHKKRIWNLCSSKQCILEVIACVSFNTYSIMHKALKCICTKLPNNSVVRTNFSQENRSKVTPIWQANSESNFFYF